MKTHCRNGLKGQKALYCYVAQKAQITQKFPFAKYQNDNRLPSFCPAKAISVLSVLSVCHSPHFTSAFYTLINL